MLTIDHDHIVLLIMLTMINFNCIALNGFLSKKFVFIVRQKICPPCNSKTLYVMFTKSREESCEPKVRDVITFLLGGEKHIF